MFFLLFLLCASDALDLKPKFQVLTPNELVVEVPHYEDRKLVTFRIGVRRDGSDADELEFGENDVDNDRVFIYDKRLNLRKGDVVNYLLAFRGQEGYQAQSGRYDFDGVYYKKPFGRRSRLRRDVTEPPETTPIPRKYTTVDTSLSNLEFNTEETEEFNPIEPRFGHHPHHHWGHGHGFNPFGPPRRQPPYPGFPPPYAPPSNGFPPFGNGCNDHRHDGCHGRDSERWRDGPVKPQFTPNVEYHCKMCNSLSSTVPTVQVKEVSTRRTTSTTEEDSPDIDIRFSD